MGRKKKYFTEKELLQAHREADKRWRENNLESYKESYTKRNEKRKSYNKTWYENNKNEILKKQKERSNTFEGHCAKILSNCICADRRKGRIEKELPTDYITLEQTMELIGKSKCAHYDTCGCDNWRELGLNRLDNSKPHTYDNCEPCCFKCNCKLNDKERMKIVYQYNKNDELLQIWSSISECEKAGYTHAWECCLGKRKTNKGCKFSYEPL